MEASKIFIDGKEVNISLGIDEDEIEKNDEFMFDTLDLKEVVDSINERKDTKDQ